MDPASLLPAPPGLETLLEEGGLSLFLDFDGTLVGLAPRPEAIRPAARLGERIAGLADRLDGCLALVSGRALSDIERHIGPLGVASAGSHGTDIRARDGRVIGVSPRSLPAALQRELRGFAERNGLDYEDKPHGGALHYRRRPEQEGAARRFASALAETHGWALQEGKFVIELVAPGASKGGAVRALMAEPPFAETRPVFIGDDLTDEAGFAACEDHGGFGILVGDRVPTAARFRLPDVDSVHRWLAL